MARCFECGQPGSYSHHVVPRSRGGRKTVPLCGQCHAKVHGSRGLLSIRRLTKDALQHKIRNRERVGKVRFGFDLSADGVTLTPNPAEQTSLELMRQLRAAGRTLRQIAAELTARAIPTKEGNRTWSHTAVAYILKSLDRITT